MKKLGKKLSFSKQTIRTLVDHELDAVQGGIINNPDGACTYKASTCVSTNSVDKCYSAINRTC